jgi:hypothetical protein
MLNWKGSGRKWSWSNLRIWPSVYRKKLRICTNIRSYYSVVPDRDSNHAPPSLKSELEPVCTAVGTVCGNRDVSGHVKWGKERKSLHEKLRLLGCNALCSAESQPTFRWTCHIHLQSSNKAGRNQAILELATGRSGGAVPTDSRHSLTEHWRWM